MLELDRSRDSMQNFNFNHLYYFHVVAGEGSLARAARVLEVTQPTISEQIKQLEGFLGAKLFDRRPGGGLRLNEAGRRVYEHTSLMFRTSNRLLAAFAPGKVEDVQVLDIGVASSVSRIFAAELFLPLFEMGDVRPRIRIGENDALLHELISLEVDLVLSDATPPEPKSKGLEVRVVHEPVLIIVASEAVAARIGNIPAGLNEAPFIGYTIGSRHRWEIDQYFYQHGVRPELRGEVDDVSLMLAAARQGVGFAILPESMATDALQAGTLRRLGQVESIESRVLGLFHHPSTPPRVHEAIDLLTRGASPD